jgi:uncharacterized protein YcbK (DUF882 family)
MSTSGFQAERFSLQLKRVKDVSSKRLLCATLIAGAALLASSTLLVRPAAVTKAAEPSASAQEYRLRMFHTHTGEYIDVVYRKGQTYRPQSIAQLDHFLRDHRTGDVHAYNPHLFDLLVALEKQIGRPGAVIDVICGYRTPWSNAFLREHSAGVALHSLHMEAEAIDIRIPGVSTLALRNAALALHLGGVGYYPVSDFVHVDVGRVRQWSLGVSRTDSVTH